MSENARGNERFVLEQLLEALRELPQVEASTPVGKRLESGDQYRIDAEMRLDIGGTDIVLLIEIKKSVYPRDVRQILWQLNRYAREPERRASGVPFLAAASISQGARELLRHENVGYYDTGGSLYVPARGIYILVEKPPPKTLEKSVRSLFRGKRAGGPRAAHHARRMVRRNGAGRDRRGRGLNRIGNPHLAGAP